jgi:hypothetical protein
MIKLVGLHASGDRILRLRFSDGAEADWSADHLIARDTGLTRPLADPSFFARAFIEGGALAWPNGLELSPAALHASLDATGALRRRAA